MSKEKHFVKNSNGRTYQWVDVEELKSEEIIAGLERDAYHADSGMVVAFIVFVVFINSCVGAALFAGIIRTVAMKANPAVNTTWLSGEIQAIMLIAVIWLIVTQVLVLAVYSRAARIIANG